MSQQEFSNGFETWVNTDTRKKLEEAILEKIAADQKVEKLAKLNGAEVVDAYVKNMKHYKVPIEGYVTAFGVDLLDAMKFIEKLLATASPNLHLKPKMDEVKVREFKKEEE